MLALHLVETIAGSHNNYSLLVVTFMKINH